MTSPAPTLAHAPAEVTLSLERYDDLRPAPRATGPRWPRGCGNPFATWEWATTWWDHFGSERPLLITAVPPARRIAGRPPPALPLAPGGAADGYASSVTASATSSGRSARSEDAALAASALRQTVHDEGRSWDLLLAERMPAGSLEGSLPGHILQEEANPLLPIDGATWEEFLASCSGNMRGQIRNKRNRLEQQARSAASA